MLSFPLHVSPPASEDVGNHSMISSTPKCEVSGISAFSNMVPSTTSTTSNHETPWNFWELNRNEILSVKTAWELWCSLASRLTIWP